MGAAGQAVTIRRRFAKDTKTDGAHKPDIDDPAVAEASRAKVDIDTGRQDEMPAGALVGQKRHHQVLQQAAGFVEGDVDTLSGVGGLLQEDGVAAELAHVDGDVQSLAGEDAVHDGDVLVRGVGGAADGDDQDARLEAGCAVGWGVGGGGGWVCSACCCSGCGGSSGGVYVGGAVRFCPGQGTAVDVAQEEC